MLLSRYYCHAYRSDRKQKPRNRSIYDDYPNVSEPAGRLGRGKTAARGGNFSQSHSQKHSYETTKPYYRLVFYDEHVHYFCPQFNNSR